MTGLCHSPGHSVESPTVPAPHLMEDVVRSGLSLGRVDRTPGPSARQVRSSGTSKEDGGWHEEKAARKTSLIPPIAKWRGIALFLPQ